MFERENVFCTHNKFDYFLCCRSQLSTLCICNQYSARQVYGHHLIRKQICRMPNWLHVQETIRFRFERNTKLDTTISIEWNGNECLHPAANTRPCVWPNKWCIHFWMKEWSPLPPKRNTTYTRSHSLSLIQCSRHQQTIAFSLCVCVRECCWDDECFEFNHHLLRQTVNTRQKFMRSLAWPDLSIHTHRSLQRLLYVIARFRLQSNQRRRSEKSSSGARLWDANVLLLSFSLSFG